MRTKQRARKTESGQVLTEYVIVLVMFALLAVSSLVLAHYFSLYGGRMVDYVSIEYP